MRYLIVEAITGAPARAYYIDAPAAAGTIHLDTAAQAVPGPELTAYLLASAVGQVGGPAGPLDAGGKVPAGQLPVAGGGVPATRVVATTAPLAGGGDLTATGR
jgi:hypothetical protein